MDVGSADFAGAKICRFANGGIHASLRVLFYPVRVHPCTLTLVVANRWRRHRILLAIGLSFEGFGFIEGGTGSAAPDSRV